MNLPPVSFINTVTVGGNMESKGNPSNYCDFDLVTVTITVPSSVKVNSVSFDTGGNIYGCVELSASNPIQYGCTLTGSSPSGIIEVDLSDENVTCDGGTIYPPQGKPSDAHEVSVEVICSYPVISTP